MRSTVGVQSDYGILTSSPWKLGSQVIIIVAFCVASAVAVGSVYSELIDFSSEFGKPSNARATRHRHATLLQASVLARDPTGNPTSSLAYASPTTGLGARVASPEHADMQANAAADVSADSGQVKPEQVQPLASDEKVRHARARHGTHRAKMYESEHESWFSGPWGGHWSGFGSETRSRTGPRLARRWFFDDWHRQQRY